MKAKATILVIISFLLVSCEAKLAASETKVPTKAPLRSASMTQDPVVTEESLTTDTPISGFTLRAVLQGNWLVEARDASGAWITLGTLAINGNRYRFYPIPGAEVPSWMEERFCFFDKPAGEIVLEYQTGISPNDDVRASKDSESLLTCAGIGCSEKFLIRVDQDGQELYFHALISEIPLYRIHKNYND